MNVSDLSFPESRCRSSFPRVRRDLPSLISPSFSSFRSLTGSRPQSFISLFVARTSIWTITRSFSLVRHLSSLLSSSRRNLFSRDAPKVSRLSSLSLTLAKTDVDCLPGDIIQVIEIDGKDHDEDAFLNNSDGDDDFTSSRHLQEANSGFGGTRLGGGGGGGGASNGNRNGKRSREASATSGAEDDWDLDPNLGLGEQDVAMAGTAAGGSGGGGICPVCSESSSIFSLTSTQRTRR